MPSRPRLYLAFGSNLWREQMRSRCPSSRPLYPVVVTGYLLHFARTATIAPSRSAKAGVNAAIYEVTESDLALLDRFEGVAGQVYERVALTLDLPSASRPVEVVTYLKLDARPAPPSIDYLARLRQGLRDWGYDERRLNSAIDRSHRDVARRHRRVVSAQPTPTPSQRERRGYINPSAWYEAIAPRWLLEEVDPYLPLDDDKEEDVVHP